MSADEPWDLTDDAEYEDNIDVINYGTFNSQNLSIVLALTIIDDYDLDDEEAGSTGIVDIDDVDDPALALSSDDECPETIEIGSVDLDCGRVEPGCTVELKDTTGRTADHLLSGDFLRVKSITENLQTAEIKLRGWIFRRNSYQRPLFDFIEHGKYRKAGMLRSAHTNLRQVLATKYL